MILSSMTLYVYSIVLLIGTIFGASATNTSADNPFKSIADNPFDITDNQFKNIGNIDNHSPFGFVDKIMNIPSH